MQNDSLNTRALFTDQTQEFLKVQTIKPLKKYGRKHYVIRIRLRTAAGDVDRSILLTEHGEVRMQVEKENAHFIYFSAEITSYGRPVRYAFRLRLADTGEEILQNTMEFVKFKMNPEPIGARVVEGWALSDISIGAQ